MSAAAPDTPILDLEPPPPPGTPARGRWFLRVLAGLVVLFVVFALAVAWLLETRSGARFVLDRVVRMAGDGIRYEGVEGSLGGPMRIKLIEVNRPDMYARVEDFEMDTSPLAVLRRRLLVYRLEAGKVEVRTATSEAAAKVPVSFAPPYAIRLDRGHVGELRLGALTKEAAAEKDPAKKRALMDASRATDLVVKDILVRGAGDEKFWKLDEASAQTPYGKGSVSGTLETAAPFTLDAKGAFEGVAAERPYRANAALKGTLKSFEARLDGDVSGQHANARARSSSPSLRSRCVRSRSSRATWISRATWRALHARACRWTCASRPSRRPSPAR